MKKISIILVLATSALLSSCASSVPTGSIYTDVTMPVAASSTTGNKVGQSVAKSYLGIIAVGDASIEAAKAAGGISVVSSVDHKAENILGVIGTYTTTVKGR